MSKQFHILLGLLLLNFGLKAQDLENSSTQIDVNVNRYTANSNKLSNSPKMVDTLVSVPTKNYPKIIRQKDVTTDIEKIEPARLKIIQPITKLYNNYVKVGLGMYLSPYVDLHVMEKRSRAGLWGVNLKHFSSRDAHKDYQFSGFSDNKIELYGTKFYEYHALSGKLLFDHNGLNHYGTMNDTTINRAQIKQRFYNYEMASRYHSYYEDSTHLDKDINLGYYYFRDHKDIKDSAKFDFGQEHHFNINAELGKYMNKEYLQGDIGIDYNQIQAKQVNDCPQCDTVFNSVKRGNAILSLGFRVITQREKFRIKAGLKIDVDMPDHRTSNPKLFAFPDVEVKYSLFNDIFVPYIGVTRELKRNSFKTLARNNPFILSSPELINTNNKYKLYGGFKGTLSSRTDFNIGVNHGLYESVPLFLTDTTYSFDNRFEVVYDTFNITSFFGELSFHKGEELRIYGKGEYFLYSQGRERQPWYMPQYQFTIGATYDMSDKIIARFKTYVLGGRKAASYEQVEGQHAINGVYTQDLGTFVDINLGGEYRYSKRLSLYLDFNNILAKQYQLYRNYPLQGINIIGGLTWSF